MWQDYVVGAFTVTQATAANLAEAFVVEGATSLDGAANEDAFENPKLEL